MLALAIWLGLASPVGATVTEELQAVPEQLWSVAVRYLRVEADFPVKEKDCKAGYILFKVPARGEKHYRGALEIISLAPPAKGSPDGGTAAVKSRVKLQITVKGAPTYIERHIMDHIMKKLARELP